MMELFVFGILLKLNEFCVINDCCYRLINVISDYVIRGRLDMLFMEIFVLFSCIFIILMLN